MTDQDVCPHCRYYCDWEDDGQQNGDILVQAKTTDRDHETE
jgi:hypothetical protein